MRVSLHLATSFDATWEDVLLPWFEKIAPQAFQQSAAVAVVTPFRSHAQLLRGKLLAHGISLLGVRFLVPAQLRDFLLRDSGLKPPLREHLRLLLATAAEEFVTNIDSEQSDSLIARAVARDPDYFLRLFDELDAAGWDVAKLGQPMLAEIAAQFEKMCRECGLTFVREADRHAVANAAKLPPRFSRLLVTGFDGAHWPLWPLLNAAVTSSQEATVILNDPRDEARDVNESWVGAWEEILAKRSRFPSHTRRRTERREKKISRTKCISSSEPTQPSKLRPLSRSPRSSSAKKIVSGFSFCFRRKARCRDSWPVFFVQHRLPLTTQWRI